MTAAASARVAIPPRHPPQSLRNLGEVPSGDRAGLTRYRRIMGGLDQRRRRREQVPGAVRPFERLLARERPTAGISGGDNSNPVESRSPEPTDRLFPNEFKKMFNNLLADNKLKLDRNGKARTAYSLRHSYICFRLLEGADIYQVAKNCRTSVEMIEKHYAAHLKDMIDASLINIRKKKQRLKEQTRKKEESGRQPDA